VTQAYASRICGNCNAEFWKLAKYLQDPTQGLYCSRSCGTSAKNRARKGTGWTHRGLAGEENPNWKGGVSKDWSRYKRRFAEKFPEKARAHQIVANALRAGTLTRQPCSKCGSETKVQAHHDDYSKPLQVIWLCQLDHIQHHAELRRLGADPDRRVA
jgi:hypothetical protein